MNILALKFVAKLRGVSQSKISEFANVSRQRVSQWFAQSEEFVNIGTIPAAHLASQLNVSCDVLLQSMPGLVELKRTQSSYVWDHRFPDIETFVIAAMSNNLEAMARAVEVHGLYGTAEILGDIVWDSFDKFKRYLPPKKRQAMEAVWHLRQNID
jgi:transcriptional regulator with XRE-family HTH domain